MICFTTEEGHFIETDPEKWDKKPISIFTLTDSKSKNKYGIENLGPITVDHTTHVDEARPLSFWCNLNTPDSRPDIFNTNQTYKVLGWHVKPYKSKKESLIAAENANNINLEAYAITLNNYIDMRNGKYFITRKMTYYTISIKPLHDADPISQYIYNMSNIFPLVALTSDYVLTKLDTLLEYENRDLSPYEYMRYREILSKIQTIYFSVLDKKYLDI